MTFTNMHTAFFPCGRCKESYKVTKKNTTCHRLTFIQFSYFFFLTVFIQVHSNVLCAEEDDSFMSAYCSFRPIGLLWKVNVINGKQKLWSLVCSPFISKLCLNRHFKVCHEIGHISEIITLNPMFYFFCVHNYFRINKSLGYF